MTQAAEHSPSHDKPIMSSMWGSTPRWERYVAFYRPERVGTLADHRRMWSLARGRRAVILLGAVSVRHRYRDLVFALALKYLRRRPPRVLITDATWEPGSRALAARTHLPESVLARLVRGVIGLIDGPHVHYAVLSRDEIPVFSQTWGVPTERIVFTPFPATIPADTPTSEGDYVFAGGNSLRDYDLLEEALERSGQRAVVASTWRPRRDVADVRAGTLPHEEYVRLLAGARAVVTPLQTTVRSAGQQTYLNAMLLGKVAVVTDAPGVRDYVTDGVTGVIVPPTAEALAAALRDIADPARAEHYRAMGQRAREYVLAHHTYERYFDDAVLGAIGLPASV